MFYVPQKDVYQHGKRVPLKTYGYLCAIPPRNARLAIKEIFPEGYWLGSAPADDCSADCPRWMWEKEDLTKILFVRNPYRRAESMWRMHPSVRQAPPTGKWPSSSGSTFQSFVEWLTGKSSGYWGWPQARWIQGGDTPDKDMIWPEYDPDYVIQTEDLAAGINSLPGLPQRLKEDDVPELKIEGEILRENYGTEWWEEYDKTTIRLVRKHFFEDFEKFGYPFDLEEA